MRSSNFSGFRKIQKVNLKTLSNSKKQQNNLSLFIIFYTLFQFTSFDLKTTHSLNDLGSNNYFSKVLIISLFSMAGVPPFWGFFSKIFIFTLLCNSHFFILFPFFFFILFLGLYFYIQNIRFLNATNGSNYQPSFEQGVRIVPIYYYTINLFLFFIIFGFMFTEDLLLVMSWILL